MTKVAWMAVRAESRREEWSSSRCVFIRVNGSIPCTAYQYKVWSRPGLNNYLLNGLFYDDVPRWQTVANLQVSAHMTGCSAIGRAGASGASGWRFKSSHSDILVRFNHNEASNFPFNNGCAAASIREVRSMHL